MRAVAQVERAQSCPIKAAIYRRFGTASNVIDGRYTCFMYPDVAADQKIFEYTLMSTLQEAPCAEEEF